MNHCRFTEGIEIKIKRPIDAVAIKITKSTIDSVVGFEFSNILKIE